MATSVLHVRRMNHLLLCVGQEGIMLEKAGLAHKRIMELDPSVQEHHCTGHTSTGGSDDHGMVQQNWAGPEEHHG